MPPTPPKKKIRYRPISPTDNLASTGLINNPVGSIVPYKDPVSAAYGQQGQFGARLPTPQPTFWQTVKNALTGNNPIQPGSTSMAGVGGSLAGLPLPNMTAVDYARLNTNGQPDQAPRAAVRAGFGQAGAGMTAMNPIGYGPTSYGLGGAPNPYAPLFQQRGKQGIGDTSLSGDKQGALGTSIPATLSSSFVDAKAQALYYMSIGMVNSMTLAESDSLGITQAMSEPDSGWVNQNGVWTQNQVPGQRTVDKFGNPWDPKTATTDIYGGEFVAEGTVKFERINGKVRKVQIMKGGRKRILRGNNRGGRESSTPETGVTTPAGFTGSYGVINFNTGGG